MSTPWAHRARRLCKLTFVQLLFFFVGSWWRWWPQRRPCWTCQSICLPNDLNLLEQNQRYLAHIYTLHWHYEMVMTCINGRATRPFATKISGLAVWRLLRAQSGMNKHDMVLRALIFMKFGMEISTGWCIDEECSPHFYSCGSRILCLPVFGIKCFRICKAKMDVICFVFQWRSVVWVCSRSSTVKNLKWRACFCFPLHFQLRCNIWS
jgi:hypothetical protein